MSEQEQGQQEEVVRIVPPISAQNAFQNEARKRLAHFIGELEPDCPPEQMADLIYSQLEIRYTNVGRLIGFRTPWKEDKANG